MSKLAIIADVKKLDQPGDGPKKTWTVFNSLVFGGTLSDIRVEWSEGLGAVVAKYEKRDGECRIFLSKLHLRRYGITQEDRVDVLLHEMIHQWCDEKNVGTDEYGLWHEDHNEFWLAKMKEVNKKFGRNITVDQSNPVYDRAVERIAHKYTWECSYCFEEVFSAIKRKPGLQNHIALMKRKKTDCENFKEEWKMWKTKFEED